MAQASSKDLEEEGSTNSQTCINMVRMLLGMGALTLPTAVARSGIIPFCLFAAVVPSLSWRTMTWAVALKEKCLGDLSESSSETDRLWTAESAAEVESANVGTTADAEVKVALQSCLGGFDLVVQEALGVSWRIFFIGLIMVVQLSGGVSYVSAINEGLLTLIPGCSQNIGLALICLTLITVTLLAPNLKDIAYLSFASSVVLLYIFVSVPIEGARNNDSGRSP